MKRLENLLNPNGDGELGDIIRHARGMGELLQVLQQSIPAIAPGSIRATNIRDNGELVILASSPAWAAKLRFEIEAIMAATRKSGVEVNSCTVRVSRG
jgi:hypothetical protein